MAARKNISNSALITDTRDMKKAWVNWGSNEIRQDVMKSILQRLPILDYLQCKAVCPSWREAVGSAIATKHCRPVPRPWIFFPRGRRVLDCKFKLYKLNLPDDDPNDQYVGAIEPGWLIKVDSRGSIFTLLNPVSRGVVNLPRYNQDPATPFILRAVASSVPFISSNPCIVACLSSDDGSKLEHVTGEQLQANIDVGGGKTSLAICRPTDKKWTQICHPQLQGSNHFEDIQFIDGKLYVATKNPSQFLMVFHFDVDVDDDILRYRVERLVTIEAGPEHERFERMFNIKKSRAFLSKDFSTSKELFMITFADSYPNDLFSHGSNGSDEAFQNAFAEAFQVFKLDDDATNNGGGGDSRSRWVEIVNFRDRLSVLRQKIPESSIYLSYCDTSSDQLDYSSIAQCVDQCLGCVRARIVCFSPNPW